MDQASPDVRRQHNAGLPIHAFPGELFIKILISSIDDLTEPFLPTAQLHIRAQVCSYWFQSIRCNPAFWHYIDYWEQKSISMILKRNLRGLLTIRCEHDLARDINRFLTRVSEHASRWESLILGQDIDAKTMKILRLPMPALKILQISDTESYGNDVVFPLSEAPGVEHINISNILLDWNSPSLSGLKFLSIFDIPENEPTLHGIVSILQASPALECLKLGNLGRGPWDQDDSVGVDEDTSDLPSRISLPALRGLILEERLSRATLYYLLSSIDAPGCQTLRASVPFDVVVRSGSTFSTLSATTIHKSKIYTLVQYTFDGISVQIISKSKPAGGYGTSDISIHIPCYDLEKWALLTHATGLPVKDSETSLLACGNPKNAQGQPLTQYEHLAFWSSAERLNFSSTYSESDVVVVLGFLRSPKVVAGKEKWACPGLKEITVFESWLQPLAAEAFGKALAEVVEGRYLASKGTEGQGEEVSKDAPAALRRIRGSRKVCDIVRESQHAEGLDLNPVC